MKTYVKKKREEVEAAQWDGRKETFDEVANEVMWYNLASDTSKRVDLAGSDLLVYDHRREDRCEIGSWVVIGDCITVKSDSAFRAEYEEENEE